jgi:hypothetical protein
MIDERKRSVTVPEKGEAPGEGRQPSAAPLHPAWRAFIRFCAEMGHGEIELLKIQDGLPVLAEKTRQKVKFS